MAQRNNHESHVLTPNRTKNKSTWPMNMKSTWTACYTKHNTHADRRAYGLREFWNHTLTQQDRVHREWVNAHPMRSQQKTNTRSTTVRIPTQNQNQTGARNPHTTLRTQNKSCRQNSARPERTQNCTRTMTRQLECQSYVTKPRINRPMWQNHDRNVALFLLF